MTSEALRWRGEAEVADGVAERSFDVATRDGVIPGVLWVPADAREPLPLVLMGHGGGGHKRDEHRLAHAHAFVREHRLAAASIDTIGHGERALPGGARPDYGPATADRMAVDWRATLDALASLAVIDAQRVGYGGVSLGTIFGLPFVAREPRIRAALLGLAGIKGKFMRETGLDSRLESDARAVRCPVLFLVQWHDEWVPREGAFALFDALGSADKRLHAHPGAHGETPAHVTATTARFLAQQLRGVE